MLATTQHTSLYFPQMMHHLKALDELVYWTLSAVHLNVHMDTWFSMPKSGSWTPHDTKLLAKTRKCDDASPHWMQQQKLACHVKAVDELVHLMPHLQAMTRYSWIHGVILEFAGLEPDFTQNAPKWVGAT